MFVSALSYPFAAIHLIPPVAVVVSVYVLVEVLRPAPPVSRRNSKTRSRSPVVAPVVAAPRQGGYTVLLVALSPLLGGPPDTERYIWTQINR